jgi:hypothetical protein
VLFSLIGDLEAEDKGVLKGSIKKINVVNIFQMTMSSIFCCQKNLPQIAFCFYHPPLSGTIKTLWSNYILVQTKRLDCFSKETSQFNLHKSRHLNCFKTGQFTNGAGFTSFCRF